MLLGVVSDTHNRIAHIHRIVSLFDRAGAETVIHTGDIASPQALQAFAALSVPLLGVWGNNDLPRSQLAAAAGELAFDFREPPMFVELAQRSIVVVHDPRDLDQLDEDSPHQVALHGHTHRFRSELDQRGRLIFNPGECAGHMPGKNAVGLLNLRTLETELLRF